MSEDTPTRVRYFDHQVLRLQEFTAEQAYHVGMRRRHNIAHHTWGIVVGLQASVDSDGQVTVTPGMAVDGYGRELVLPTLAHLSAASLFDRDTEGLDILLYYGEQDSDPAPAGYAGCAPTQSTRWQERVDLRLEAAAPATGAPWRPANVPDVDLNYGPSRSQPVPVSQRWPVPLGTVRRARTTAGAGYQYSIDDTARLYTGLRSARMQSPAGDTIQLGRTRSADARRFAVFLTQAPSALSTETASAVGDSPQLEVTRTGKGTEVIVRGDTQLDGHVQLMGSALEFDVGAVRRPQAEWQIYRSDQGQALHIEFPGLPEGVTTATKQVVIGTRNPKTGVFEPCLTIANDKSVTVHGDLHVDGGIRDKNGVIIPTGPVGLSEDVQRLYTASYFSGIGGGSSLLPQVYRASGSSGPIPPEPPAPPASPAPPSSPSGGPPPSPPPSGSTPPAPAPPATPPASGPGGAGQGEAPPTAAEDAGAPSSPAASSRPADPPPATSASAEVAPSPEETPPVSVEEVAQTLAGDPHRLNAFTEAVEKGFPDLAARLRRMLGGREV